MKDANLSSNNFSSADEAEKFQTCFAEHQKDIETKIAASDSIPLENLKIHFTQLNTSLQELQRLYSNASPFLRIYYRKIYQDALQALQTKIQETEARLLPRTKFMFKGKRGKSKEPSAVKNGAISIEGKDKVLDLLDGANTCVFSDQVDAVIVVPSETITGKAVLFSRLRNCTVKMMGAPSTVHITDIKNSSISCGPVATSVYVEAAHSCHLQLACQQLRIHESTDSEFFIHVTSKAIIEECRNVKFGIYNFQYPTIDDDYVKAELPKDVNNWQQIDDFNWLVAGQPSPNWSLIGSSS